MSRLPPTFTSIYRLFLRTSSASVLHHGSSTSNLRKLWRPAFEDAARVIGELQNSSLTTARRGELEFWLQAWNLRIDNTLAILYTSGKSKGLSHRLTRNLALLVRGEQARVDYELLPVWKSNLNTTDPLYRADFRDPQYAASQKRQMEAAPAWDAMQEVIRMAEGRHGITLGRMILKRSKFRVDEANNS
ncbi:hypothetical protein C8J57DRAFT_1215219 [Mycena rebaudengoi]|nr:hypothetical protein C8J57DRAFT_1215219 [Mycena rebaudengoi]